MVNVHGVERDQLLLMPPSLSEWLPEGHLAWFVLDVVAELDLSGFYRGLREDGRGGVSYDPGLMLGVLIYAYCVGERSSRRIERRLAEDVGFRVVAANQRPDHATLARFRRRHQQGIAELFSQVLGLCGAAGLVASGVVAIDSTKLEANASAWSNRTRRQIAAEVLAEAEVTDAAEDQAFGDRRGDELPEQWADRRDRRGRLREALRQLEAAGPSDLESYQTAREAKEAGLGHKLGGRKPNPNPRRRGRARTRLANVTDPDSRRISDGRRFVQGYNAQAAVTEDQMIVAAEVTNGAADSTVFPAMVTATAENLAGVGDRKVRAFVADAGYWSPGNASLETEAEVLIAPRPARSASSGPDDLRLHQRREVVERLHRGQIGVGEAARKMGVSTSWAHKLLLLHRAGIPDPAEVRHAMADRLASPAGAAAYAKRKTTVEPVFGNLKANLGFRRFSRRGIDATRSEWRLICTIHNLLKLHRHQLASA